LLSIPSKDHDFSGSANFQQLMPACSNSWAAVIRRKSMTSGAFKELDTAVKAYLLNKNHPPNLKNLKDKWVAWTSKLTKEGKTYSTSDRYVKGGALDDLAKLCAPPVVGAVQPLVSSGQLKSLVAARENRVVAKKTANLVFTMTGGTNMNVNMPLRYNIRKTGLGKQDAEILINPAHQGSSGRCRKNVLDQSRLQ
jgi:hypothetical protein